MRSPLLLLAPVFALALAAAEAPRFCAVCGRAPGVTYYQYTSPAHADKQPVCDACHGLKDRCFTCKMPVPVPHKLDDGRVLCDRDHLAGVFDGREARGIYEEARREIAGILAGHGVLPDRNITVALVTGSELQKQHKSLLSDHDASTTLGLTRTESTGRKSYQHHVFLLNGLPAARLAAVCAHEYTHAWLHENLPDDRKLDKDTVEGFCELVAYKLMVQRRDETQKRIILANAYTRGQVNAFVRSEQQHAFHRIVKWMKTGVDDVLAQTNKAQVLVLRDDDSPAPPLWPPPAPVPTRVPDTLKLKGISGVPARRFALINDTTLMKNEEARVRVGASNVTVRCLDIRETSVVIQLRGTTRPTELFLATND